MEVETHRELEALLASEEPEAVRRGLELASREIGRAGPAEAQALLEAVAALFYIDPLDRPDLVPVLDEAVSLVAGFGERVIPFLIERFDASDFKAHMAVAHALGRIGEEVIAPLVAQYQSTEDPARGAFILYALSKVKSPRVVAATGLALEAAGASDRELRDTGTRALGKLAESIPPSGLSDETRRAFIAQLQRNLADASPTIRAKAVRSLGKLARCGHMTPAEKKTLKATLELIAGRDARFDWDRAYVVRREAEEALQYV